MSVLLCCLRPTRGTKITPVKHQSKQYACHPDGQPQTGASAIATEPAEGYIGTARGHSKQLNRRVLFMHARAEGDRSTVQVVPPNKMNLLLQR